MAHLLTKEVIDANRKCFREIDIHRLTDVRLVSAIFRFQQDLITVAEIYAQNDVSARRPNAQFVLSVFF